MSEILCRKTFDVALPSAGSIRASGDQADQADVNDYFRDLRGRMQSVPSGLRIITHDPSLIHDPSGIGQWGPNLPLARPANPTSAAQQRGAVYICPPGYHVEQGPNGPIAVPDSKSCSTTPRDGGTAYDSCPPSPKHCDFVPLPFNTLADANFPLVGGGAGVLTSSQPHLVQSGRTGAYRGRYLYFVALDQANGFAQVPSLLTGATVNDNPQLIGGNRAANGFLSTVFEDIGPYPIDDWHPFNNTDPTTLSLTFTQFLAANTQLQYFGLFFGRAYRSMESALIEWNAEPRVIPLATA